MHRAGKVLPTLDDFVRPAENTVKTRFTKKVRDFYLAGKKQKRVYFTTPHSHSPAIESRSAQQPVTKLELEHVYGYNGRDSYGNVFYGRTDATATKMLFPGASVGVVLDTKSMTQRHLIGHTDMISCLTLHPTEPLVCL